MKGTQKITSIYQRNKIYYFKYTNTEGKRCQKSTGLKNKEKAIIYANQYIGNSDFLIQSSLIEYISLFCDINTNPKKKRAILDGSAYSKSYGELQTRYAKIIFSELKMKPALSNKSLSNLTRYDIIQFKESIVIKYGRSRTSQLIFSQFKIIISFAYKEGIINQNPTQSIPNIKYKEQKRLAISSSTLSYLIYKKNIFPSNEFWAFFTVLATTGMRRGEVLGITPSKINNGFLTIDQQFNGKEFLPPKLGQTRIIPLSKITLEALNSIKPKNKKQRYFQRNCSWITSGFRQIKGFALANFPEEEAAISMMSPHSLRHSCNTNLLIAGTSPLLVAEYLSWKHQELIDMQYRYTHFVANNLTPVSDMIDELYSHKSNIINFQSV